MTLSHLHPQDSWRDTSQSIRRVMCFQTWQSINHMTNIMLVWRMMVELLAWVSRFPAEVDVQRTSDGTCHYWVWKMSRSPIVQGARSAEDIPGRCDVTKISDWRIWQSISQTSSDLLVLDTWDVVEKYVVDNVYRIESIECQQYDNLYGNGYSRVRTIFLKSWSWTIYTCSIHHAIARGPTLVDLCHLWKVRLQPFLEIVRCISVSWWEPQLIFLLRESTISTITGSQRVTQTGHQIGHCSMSRRCHRGARWHQRWRCCVRRTSHLARAEACSRRNFLRIICPWCGPLLLLLL